MAESHGAQGDDEDNTRVWLMAGLIGAVVPTGLAAQSPPPIQGTIALEGTMTKFYKGLNALVVTTVDGAEHVYHFAKGLVVHGGPAAPEGLRPGTKVVVHYRIEGAEEAVEEIDDRRRRLEGQRGGRKLSTPRAPFESRSTIPTNPDTRSRTHQEDAVKAQFAGLVSARRYICIQPAVQPGFIRRVIVPHIDGPSCT
jgi:hypothetical protein